MTQSMLETFNTPAFYVTIQAVYHYMHQVVRQLLYLTLAMVLVIVYQAMKVIVYHMLHYV